MRKLMLVLLMSLFCFSAVSTIKAETSAVSWTAEEQAFIDAHPVITMAVDPSFVPFEFIEDGDYKGIAADYVALMEEKTGIDFQVVPNLSWTDAYYQALAGNIDILPAISKTPAREEKFLFSTMYYEVKRVIVTLNTNTDIKNIEDLYGKTVAVQINSSHHSFLLDYPEINLSLYDTVPEALAAVSDGSEVAFVGNLATSDYLIKSGGLTNLRFSAMPTDDPVGLYFAVRKDWPMLIQILNKALSSITPSEKVEINSHWVTVSTTTDYGPLLRILLFVGVAVAIGIGISVIWIFRMKKEIGRRKIVQAELEKAKIEAEQANQVKSSFMARMSHEIRTPLNAITGMSYLLKKTNITQTQRMYTDRITQASQTMLGIINDILDYSKIEAGKVELESASFSLDAVIQNMISILSVKIEEKKLGFRLIKDPSVPTWFKGDQKRIEQVLLNLLNNAVKFTDKGEVQFEIRLVVKVKDNYHLAFKVSDTGIGMSKTTLDSLFVPFTQADATINRRFGGTGLGLSIVKNLVEMMSGKIEVFSTEGEGSNFIVTLPLECDREKEEEEHKEGTERYFHDLHVLVLEKTASNMNIMDSYLSSFGIRCEMTTSPQAAIGMLENTGGKFKDPFDLFIVDYETPQENGFEYLKELRRTVKLPVMPRMIMLIPMMHPELFDQLNDNEIDIGIGKPIIPSVLHNALMELFVNRAIKASTVSEKPDSDKDSVNKVHVSILVVEDNDTNQLIAKLLLEQSGFDVLLAENGKKGVEMFQNRRDDIRLILMDLHMPVMNGYDASDEIRKLSDSIPIIAMTAEAVSGVKESCEQHGIHYYISKPFDPDYFTATVRDVLKTTGNDLPYSHKVIDKTRGMKQIGDNPVLYGMVLREYRKENLDTASRLKLTIESNRYDEARQIIHKLKGSSGSIGATELYEKASSLQKAVETGDAPLIAVLLPNFLRLLEQVLEEIETDYHS